MWPLTSGKTAIVYLLPHIHVLGPVRGHNSPEMYCLSVKYFSELEGHVIYYNYKRRYIIIIKWSSSFRLSHCQNSGVTQGVQT